MNKQQRKQLSKVRDNLKLYINYFFSSKEAIFSTWNSCSMQDNRSIPKTPAVYVLASHEEILYIGTSKCLYRRIVSYFHDHPISYLYPRYYCFLNDIKDTRSIRNVVSTELELKVYWMVFEQDQRRIRYKLENALIKTFKPLLNNYCVQAAGINSLRINSLEEAIAEKLSRVKQSA